MIGNPYKGVTIDPILEDTAPVLTLPAGGQDSVTYTVPTGRGKVQAIAVYLDNDTPADLAPGSITIAASGKTLFNNSPLLKHSTLYNSARKISIGQIDEAAPVTITGIGGANNTINVYVVFYFYDPYISTYSPTAMAQVQTTGSGV